MLTKEQVELVGQHLVDALELQLSPQGFYETIYGPKSVAGLGRLIENIIETTKQATEE